jgi:hypothetical protein
VSDVVRVLEGPGLHSLRLRPVGAGCDSRGMRQADRQALYAAIEGSWSAETCDPADREQWSSANPSLGQCGVTALVVNDFLGGDLMFADVVWPDGTAQGHHYWNRLPNGSEMDLTLRQFQAGERVLTGRVVVRPPGPPRRCAEEYQLLRDRVVLRLAERGVTVPSNGSENLDASSSQERPSTRPPATR